MYKLTYLKDTKLSNYQWIIFDLDNTLYSENEFLFFAYRRIANSLAMQFNLDPDELHAHLVSSFINTGRKGLFNSMVEKFNLKNNVMDDVLNILRSTIVEPKIMLFELSEKLLTQALAEKKNVIVVTNGHSQQQRNKISSIDWKGMSNKIHFVYANDYAPKPDVRVYHEYLKPKLGVDLARAIMVGDSFNDQEFAQNLGIPFLDIQKIA